MKSHHKKLPDSMRHKMLDLRKSQSDSRFFAKQSTGKVSLPHLGNENKSEIQSSAKSNNYSQASKNSSKHKRSWVAVLMLLLAIMLVVLSIYILLLMFAPKAQKKSAQEVQKATEAAIKENKDTLLIPSVGIQSEIAEGDVNILDRGMVWHRFPDRGNPTIGGNTILTGHSFVWGYTPQQIKKQSILYSLADVKRGDGITIIWKKQTYHYKVTGIKSVKPNATEIENKSKDSILTIYTCTQGGSADGRVVVIAEPSN